jgi:hypothetical protein
MQAKAAVALFTVLSCLPAAIAQTKNSTSQEKVNAQADSHS